MIIFLALILIFLVYSSLSEDLALNSALSCSGERNSRCTSAKLIFTPYKELPHQLRVQEKGSDYRV